MHILISNILYCNFLWWWSTRTKDWNQIVSRTLRKPLSLQGPVVRHHWTIITRLKVLGFSWNKHHHIAVGPGNFLQLPVAWVKIYNFLRVLVARFSTSCGLNVLARKAKMGFSLFLTTHVFLWHNNFLCRFFTCIIFGLHFIFPKSGLKCILKLHQEARLFYSACCYRGVCLIHNTIFHCGGFSIWITGQ